MKVIDQGKFGGVFRKTHIRNGVVIDVQDSDNIVPDEGLEYMMQAAINGGAQITSWYISMFAYDNTTPTKLNTGELFYTTDGHTEMLSYGDNLTGPRPAWIRDDAVLTIAPDPVGMTVKTTSGSEAVMTVDASIPADPNNKSYGAAILSQINKGGDTAATILLAATRFLNPGRDMIEGDVLKIEYFITGTST